MPRIERLPGRKTGLGENRATCLPSQNYAHRRECPIDPVSSRRALCKKKRMRDRTRDGHFPAETADKSGPSDRVDGIDRENGDQGRNERSSLEVCQPLEPAGKTFPINTTKTMTASTQ